MTLARKLWGTLPSTAIKVLEQLTNKHHLCVSSGDLIFFDSKWYVTHSGLLGIACRKRCRGIRVQVVKQFCEADKSRWMFKATVFRSDIRLDLIRRAVTAFQANRRQPYGPGIGAGMRHSVRWSGKGHGVSRVPRLRGTMTGAQAPGTVGGRRAHPPRPDTVWAKKINEHERRLARNAALAALKDPQMVASRGHRFPDDVTLPVVIEDGIELRLTPDGCQPVAPLSNDA